MKAIAQSENLLMLVSSDSKELDYESLCRVYDIEKDKLYPQVKVGCWLRRVFSWNEPDKKYTDEVVNSIINNLQQQK